MVLTFVIWLRDWGVGEKFAMPIGFVYRASLPGIVGECRRVGALR
jgi:hypothetical protein